MLGEAGDRVLFVRDELLLELGPGSGHLALELAPSLGQLQQHVVPPLDHPQVRFVHRHEPALCPDRAVE